MNIEEFENLLKDEPKVVEKDKDAYALDGHWHLVWPEYQNLITELNFLYPAIRKADAYLGDNFRTRVLAVAHRLRTKSGLSYEVLPNNAAWSSELRIRYPRLKITYLFYLSGDQVTVEADFSELNKR